MCSIIRKLQVNDATEEAARVLSVLIASLLLSITLTGCLLIGGSSRGGFFIFPGGLGLVVLILLVALVLRRR